MRKFKFGKLVRDRIVGDIIAHGNKPKWRVLSNDEYISELKNKLVEESAELVNSDGEETLKELADIQEIIKNLLKALQINAKEFGQIQKKKNDKAGSFRKKHYIEFVEIGNDTEMIKFYLEHPDKYPEIK